MRAALVRLRRGTRAAGGVRRAHRGHRPGPDRRAERGDDVRAVRSRHRRGQRLRRQGPLPGQGLRRHRLPGLAAHQPRVRHGGRGRGPALGPAGARRRTAPGAGVLYGAARGPAAGRPGAERGWRRPAMEQALLVRDEAQTLLAAASRPGGRGLRRVWRRSARTGALRALAPRIVDPALRGELLAVCGRLASAAAPLERAATVVLAPREVDVLAWVAGVRRTRWRRSGSGCARGRQGLPPVRDAQAGHAHPGRGRGGGAAGGAAAVAAPPAPRPSRAYCRR